MGVRSTSNVSSPEKNLMLKIQKILQRWIVRSVIGSLEKVTSFTLSHVTEATLLGRPTFLLVRLSIRMGPIGT